MKRVEHYTQAQARDFFERLAVYSAEYVRVAIPKLHPHWPSTNHYDEWQHGHPIGHTLHYTAGTNFAGTLRHFVLQHRASTQWVVAKALDRRFDQIRKDLDLAKDLRSEAVQVVSPDHPAWHAGWVNRYLAGTEIRNAGILRPHLKGKPIHPGVSWNAFFMDADPEELEFFWWPEGWTTPFRGEVIRVQSPKGVTWWESFSRGSVATVITILRYLNAMYPGELDPVWMLAHHNLNPQKNDIVLPLDLQAIRHAVLYSTDHVDDLEWLAELDDVEDKFEDQDDPWMLRELDERQADRAEEDLDDFNPLEIEGDLDTPEETVEALRRLGYYVGWPEVDQDAVHRSVRIFQRSWSLSVDGDAGPKTRGALDRELRRWRIR